MTPEQHAALEAVSVKEIYFAEFSFLTDTARICSLNVTVPWDGHDWLGVGGLVSIGEIEESEGATAKPLNLTLNAAQLSWLSLAAGSVEEYRGRTAKVWMCPLDEGFQMIGAPEICWRGTMQLVTVGVEGNDGSITLNCETDAFGMRRNSGVRLSALQHKMTYPTDTGFDHITRLMANSVVWLSKKFQRQ